MQLTKLIFILILSWSLSSLGCKKAEAPKVKVRSDQSRITTEKTESDKRELESLLSQLRKINPFRPDHVGSQIGVEAGAKEIIGLKGIIWDPQNPYALFGDKVVVVGDYLDNKKVIKINKDSIILDNQGQEEILKLEGVSQ